MGTLGVGEMWPSLDVSMDSQNLKEGGGDRKGDKAPLWVTGGAFL
jgi:hypothetical protein